MAPPRKARSRLKKKRVEKPVLRSRKKLTLPKISFSSFQKFRGYLRFLPFLVLASMSYGLVWWLISNISPTQVQDVLFAKSYLPFHALFMLGHFFLFSFLLRHPKWGILFALGIEWPIFLKLQGFTFSAFFWISWVSLMTLLAFGLLLAQAFSHRKPVGRKRSRS